MAVAAVDVSGAARAASLAAELGAPLVDVSDLPGRSEGLCLLVSGHDCRLLVRGFAQPLGMAVDDPDIRRRAASGRRLELLRACGWPLAGKRVLDATAGFGRDAFVLAWAGAQVDMIEREPVLQVLLHDALVRAPAPPALRLFAGDAATRMAEVFDGHDVVYLDPMFEREGSALPQRDAQVLAQVARKDDGEAGGGGLLLAALALRPARIVVKRARTQPPLLATPAPHHRIVGRRVRFDVYAPA
jgi:16S rRNA (guanine1516-N2)-methyltransferase